MTNADKSAYPFHYSDHLGSTHEDGLTKRERFCLENKVPRTGDQELDDIIRQSLKQDAVMAAMQGLLANPPKQSLVNNGYPHYGTISQEAASHADELLKELEETQ